MSVRVRFAPSPTGYLHVGGARTALFNWLFARNNGGEFILRIEDTDENRSDQEMVSVILEGLETLGLDWDEGPYFQSERTALYRKNCEQLLEKGLAYYDFSEQGSAPDEYRCFRDLPLAEAREKILEGQEPAVRFRVPGEGTIKFRDLVFGDIAVQSGEVDDFVIARSRGIPTYHLSVVSDDIDMSISHVIRGADHLSNTTKHVLLFEALDYPVPVFAHLPLILGVNKKRLSKRHGAASVSAYIEKGLLPDALRNYLALLGWSPGGDREIMSVQELIELFDLPRVNRANAVFDPAKLEWMNKQYLSALTAEELLPAARKVLLEAGLFNPEFDSVQRSYFLDVINLIKSRITSLKDFSGYGLPFFTDDFDYEEEALSKYLGVKGQAPAGETVQGLNRFRDTCADESNDFNLEKTEEVLRSIASELNLKAGILIGAVRLAVTGRSRAPGIFDVLVTLGRDRTVKRLNRLLEMLRDN